MHTINLFLAVCMSAACSVAVLVLGIYIESRRDEKRRRADKKIDAMVAAIHSGYCPGGRSKKGGK